MLGRVTDRIDRAKSVAGQATTLPFAVRCVVALCGVAAMLVAWPAAITSLPRRWTSSRMASALS